MKIWNVAIRQPIFMSMVLLAGIVLGTLAFVSMPVNLFPDVEFPVLLVSTVYPGASPEEVEDQITSVLEEELSTATGLDSVQSTSAEGVSTIVLQFDLEVPVDEASQDVREKVNRLRNQLPTGIREPVIQTFDPNSLPILGFSIADRSGSLPLLELRQLVESEVKAPLERVPGISAVDVNGGEVREIQVDLDSCALESLRISPQQVTSALQAANINMPGGTVNDGEQELLVRTPANLQAVEDIENVIVVQRTAPILISDVAAVVDGFEKNESITRLNGEDAIVVSIRKQSSTNTVAVADAAKETLEKISEAYPNLEIVVTSDQSIRVRQSTEGAIDDLLYAALLASLVMLFFFRDFRNTFVTIAGLPVIMITTIFFMDVFGISLNQISLLALALVVGLVIDDGIVVRENILRWVGSGYSPRVGASLGTSEVVLPVLATSAAILAVFIPVAYAQGIIGKFFFDFGMTVSIAIIVSTVEALTMAPMLSAYFFKSKEGAMDVEPSELDDLKVDKVASPDEEKQGHGWLYRFYGSLLGWTLRHKLITGFIALAVIVVSFASVTFIEVTFLPSFDQDEFTTSMSLPGGTPLAVTEREAIRVEEIIASHPQVEAIVTQIGGTGSPEKASFTVKLDAERPREQTAKSIINDLRAPLAGVPGVLFAMEGGGPGGSNSDITVEVTGNEGVSYAALGEQAQQLAGRLAEMSGLVDIDVSYKAGRPEMQVAVDRQRASDLGLSPAQIASTVRLLVNGEIATTFRGEGDDADIRVQLGAGERADADDILAITMLSSAGQLVPLRNVAAISMAVGPNQIRRVDRQPTITVEANVIGRTAPSAVSEASEMLATLQLPDGVEMSMGGSARDGAEAFGSLLLALGLAVMFIYMVLASQFASLVQPILIMLALPLAIIGAILALLIAGKPLDMTAFIGFIMLMGLATKNSILLVDFANRARAKGETANDAMRIAGPVRLRPILMTSLSLILAMIPIALGYSAGGEFRQSMAIAIMGGMISSTFLTLIIVPLGYGSVVGLQDRLAARRARRRMEKAPVQDPALQQGFGPSEPVATPQSVGD